MVIMDDAIADWEVGLPSADDLTPLSHSLIPSELAYAFKISVETPRTMVEVNNASRITFSSLRLNPAAPNFKSFEDDHVIAESEPFEEVVGSDPKRIRETDEETIDNCTGEQGKAVKRPRLVWTPQLHKRFVDVVTHLGLKNAVPKTIMDLMNVEGLTRENVASHLQKYRLYVKRMSDEGPSPSDHLLASRPMPPTQSFNEPSSSQGNGNFKGNHSNNNNCGNENSYSRMQMPMMELGPGNVNFSGEFHGYEDEYSPHHHHQHHHHYYEQQYGNMAQ